ncbi:hypothetical protein ACLOJK_027440, partial [Asimina triloba]
MPAALHYSTARRPGVSAVGCYTIEFINLRSVMVAQKNRLLPAMIGSPVMGRATAGDLLATGGFLSLIGEEEDDFHCS